MPCCRNDFEVEGQIQRITLGHLANRSNPGGLMVSLTFRKSGFSKQLEKKFRPTGVPDAEQ